VFGRKTASLSDCDYSDALKSANSVWNEEMFDKWLTDPQTVAHGAKMFVHLNNSQDRAGVIAYLEERAEWALRPRDAQLEQFDCRAALPRNRAAPAQ
jgi:cytochrome c2